MLLDILKFAFSSLRARAGQVLSKLGKLDVFSKLGPLVKKGWSALSDFVRKGVSSMLMPELTPEQHASIGRLRALAMEELKRRAAREEEQAQAAAKKARAKEQAREEAKGSAAAEKTTAGEASAAAKPLVVYVPEFGASPTIRTAAVFKAVAPIAIKAIFRGLAQMPARPVDAEALAE